MARTERAGVMGTLGGFGGMFDLSKTGVKEPVLISGTDGVGTIDAGLSTTNTIRSVKTVLLCVLTISSLQVLSPSYFLDYIATGKNEPAKLSKSLQVLQKVVFKLGQPPLLVGKQLKCLVCMVKMTMIWLGLLSVLQKISNH